MKTALTPALAVILGLVGQANAESGFPKNFPIEVSGLAIGQTAEEAKARLEELFPNNIEYVAKTPYRSGPDRIIRTGDRFVKRIAVLENYKAPFPAAYLASTVAAAMTPNSVTEYRRTGNGASVLISSPETGSKVEGIYREIAYDSPKDPEAVRKQVVEQFGEPHAEIKGWGYIYSFKDGAPMEVKRGDQAYRQCAQIDNAVRDIAIDKETHVLAPSQFFGDYFTMNPLKAHNPITKVCDGSFQVRPTFDDNGLVTGISFTFLDHKAMLADMNALQAALAAAKPPAPIGDQNVEKF